MGLAQVNLSVCNDGNVSQLDVTDPIHGGIYHRIEVYRCSHPVGGYGVTLSGSRVEDIAGDDHLAPDSNRVFRYTYSIGDHATPKGAINTVLEGREEFNPSGTPDGSWDVRIRDIDSRSPTYGAVIHVTARPTDEPKRYDIEYDLRRPHQTPKKVPISSPLARRLTKLNPDLVDLGSGLEAVGCCVCCAEGTIKDTEEGPLARIALLAQPTIEEVSHGLSEVLTALDHPDFELFRKNMDQYEEFGDYGAKATHPGTNLTGPNARLAAESIFVRQYRAALVLLGRVVSPDMALGAAAPRSLVDAPTNTRPGVYQIFVGATVNNIGIYKLGLDKVHSDYGGIPMAQAPGSRLENGAEPVADAWRCNQTLGDIADSYYLSDPAQGY